MRKYQKDRVMIAIRYLLMLILVASYINFSSASETIYLMLLLLFVINNQLRFFTFEGKVFTVGSILVDFVLIYFLTGFPIPFFSSYFLLTGMDVVLALDLKGMLVFNGLLLLQMGVMYKSFGMLNLLINLIFFLIWTLMMYQLKNQYEKKAEAQKFYDQLRIKEDELVQLNHKLEKYADTVENLTLLRERNRITMEIHDQVGHRLSATIIQLSAIEKVIFTDREQGVAMIRNLRQYQQASLQNIRELINELKPKAFDRYEGLLMIEQVAKSFEKLTNVAVKVSVLNDEELTWALSEKQSFALYPLVQEALSNSLRHGKATQVEITFNFQEHQLVLMIQDNGSGRFEVLEGNGIVNMRQRLKALGGQVNYQTAANEGFFLVITMPRVGGMRDGN